MTKDKLKLDCTGCGSSLFQTNNPQVYQCERCDTSYKIQFDNDGINLVEVKETIGNVKNLIILRDELKELMPTYNKTAKTYSDAKNYLGCLTSILTVGIFFAIIGIMNKDIFVLLVIGGIMTLIGGILTPIYAYLLKKFKPKFDYIQSKKTSLENRIKELKNKD